MSAKRIVLITGAGSGIGFDAACRFMNNGAFVIGCDWSEKGLSKLEEYARDTQAEAKSLLLDVSQNIVF
jgi:NADP-dependent 3-hydroxy acid dehydrogenase YdfG